MRIANKNLCTKRNVLTGKVFMLLIGRLAVAGKLIRQIIQTF